MRQSPSHGGSDSVPIDAILFDLYGTLVAPTGRPFSRGLPAALGVSRREWMALLRGGLLTSRFEDVQAFARHVAAVLTPPTGDRAATAGICAARVEAECASVAVLPGVRSLLAFLSRRGLRLGLVSNVASPFIAPVAALGLDQAFEVAVYSCEAGMAKPDPAIYELALGRLGVAPSQALFVGDSLPNDVRAPAAAGCRTAGIGVTGGDVQLRAVAELGLHDLSRADTGALLSVGDAVSLGPLHGVIEALEPVADDHQGRYNLVYRGTVRHRAATDAVFVKRFLLPETVHVEACAYRLQAQAGLPACEAAIHAGSEPLLLVSEAPGRKWAEDLTKATAYGLGGHFVFALLFSNADIRPRNAFIEGDRVTLVDLEHCFFNLAIETEGLESPERPETFDRLPADALTARIRKRVLSARATSRARRSFFGDTPKGSAIDEAFHAGFLDCYRRLQREAETLLGLLRARLAEDPPLIIGTQAYRRAMAEVDVRDIARRLAEDPQVAYEATW